MSDLIRPEIIAAARRWRDVLIGLGVVCLGLYWAFFTGAGLLRWIGYVVGLIGIALVYSGFQRVRFRSGGGGAGIVHVVEGRVTYFGPLSGGVADLDNLDSLEIDHSSNPAHWIMRQPGQPPLGIPVNAEGSDALFDVFAALPGMHTERLLKQLHAKGTHTDVVWRSDAARARLARLH